jgi:hypothetical protein
MRWKSELYRKPEPTIEELVVSLAETIEHLCPKVTTAEALPIAEELVLACEAFCGTDNSGRFLAKQWKLTDPNQ